jgi:hypothetical protein
MYHAVILPNGTIVRIPRSVTSVDAAKTSIAPVDSRSVIVHWVPTQHSRVSNERERVTEGFTSMTRPDGSDRPPNQLPPEREPRTRSEVVSEVLDRHGISEQDRDEIVQEVLSSLDAELHDQIKSKRGKVADLNQQLETAERELRELVRAYSEGRKPLE